MTLLVNATFAAGDRGGGVIVRVARRCRTSDNDTTWTVTVKNPSNVVSFRRFSALGDALAFASETLANGQS
jgi:hypothetical protein